MDLYLPNGVSGSLHRPVDLLDRDPTPLDEAVYIPSVTPGYAVAAYKQDWARDLPEGVGSGDLNFLDPDNELFRISHVMSSAGQALLDTRPCIIKERDRSATRMIGDSGGYQIASGNLRIRNDQDRMKILRWLEQHADWAMTLDVPTGPIDKPGYAFKDFNACLTTTLDHLQFFQQKRKEGATRFLNVLQGNTTQQSDKWFDEVKGYPFEGWAFAGKLRHNFYNLCRRIIMMADQKLLEDRDWIHILGTNELGVAVGLSALQRAINRKINPRLRISYDTSTPFRMNSWHGVYSLPFFDSNRMTLKQVRCPDARHLLGSKKRFPWSSPIGDRMTLGDLSVKTGVNLNSYHDAISHHLLANHNLASLCYAVSLANRVFDAEKEITKADRRIQAKHSADAEEDKILAETHRLMAEAVKAIDDVIDSCTLQALERNRGHFRRIRPINEPVAHDEDREFPENFWE